MDQPHATRTVPVDDLRAFVARIFAAAGCDASEAERIGFYLVSANLAGHDSHGVVRVPRYVQVLKLGQVRAGQTLRIVSETPTQALVDGNFGLGQTIAPLAVDVGIAKAKAAGVAVIGLYNSGHIGRIGDSGGAQGRQFANLGRILGKGQRRTRPLHRRVAGQRCG